MKDPGSAGAGVAAGEAVLYRDAPLADGRSDALRLGVSILVEDATITWIRPADYEGRLTATTGVVDASGATIVPGMVDAHSHLTLPGGAHWIERIDDPPKTLAAVAEDNARLLTAAGVRWARDVGAPVVNDPVDGRRRALSLGVRDRWRGRAATRTYARPAPGSSGPGPSRAIGRRPRTTPTSSSRSRNGSSTTGRIS